MTTTPQTPVQVLMMARASIQGVSPPSSGPGSQSFGPEPQASRPSVLIPDASVREKERLDAIEHAQDRDYWRTERERESATDLPDDYEVN